MSDEIHIVGALRDAMWKGELAGKIRLDTIAPKEHMYGLGPLEHLRGELFLTHHDTYMHLHLHLLTKDKFKVGHLDAATFNAGAMCLYLPANQR